jgi:hypothetical protein
MSDDPAATVLALARWRWQATSGGRTYNMRLDDLHVAEDPDRFPYIEGHQLNLQWRDAFYPEHLARSSSRDRFLPQLEFRYERPEHLDGPFWSEQITEDLRVDVTVAKPAARFGDDMTAESVLHVSYQAAGRPWIVIQAKPMRASVVLPAPE